MLNLRNLCYAEEEKSPTCWKWYKDEWLMTGCLYLGERFLSTVNDALTCSLCRQHTRFWNRACISYFTEAFFPRCVKGIWCMFLYNEGGKITKGKKRYGPLPPPRSASLLCFWRRCLQSDFLQACPQILKLKYAFAAITAHHNL